MEKDKLTEIGKLCSSNSVLVVSKHGIFRLYCPFKATCILQVESYTIGQVVTVVAVKMNPDLKIIYIIQNKGYYHTYFTISSETGSVQTTFN